MEYDINEEFSRISREDWKELLTLIPQIEKADYSNVVTGWDYPDIVHKFHNLVNDKGMVLLFDWPNWEEGKELIQNKDADYSSLDLLTMSKLITAMVRYNRFSTGFLGECFEDGIVLKILYRIKNIIYQQ